MRPAAGRGLRLGPLLVALLTCALFATAGGVLVGDALGSWFGALEKPPFLVPLPVFFAVGGLYYLGAGVVLYRVLTRLRGRARRRTFWAVVGVLALNEAWNALFFGLRSTLAGFLGIAVFLVALGALWVLLARLERGSSYLILPYALWVVYDLAWTYALWRLNP